MVDAEKFVRVWMTSKNLTEVASRMGCAYGTASQKASFLRARGVKLPYFGTPEKIDVASLNSLITRMKRI